MTRRLDVTLALLLFTASLGLRLALLAPYHFDGLYGQDAFAYYDFAQELRLAVAEGRMPGPFFWPLGYPALLASVFGLFGEQAMNGQMTNILLGALLSPLVYVLARLMSTGQVGALVAGLLMAVCGQALQSSLVLMADVPALFWATLSAVVLWHYLHRRQARWLAVSFGLLGLACITRWLYLLLYVPWGLTIVISWRGRIRWRDCLAGCIGLAVVFLPQIVYSVGTASPGLSHAWVEGWAVENTLRHEFTNVDGHFEYEKVNALFYAQPFYDAYYLAPVFAPFLLIGVGWLVHRRRFAEVVMLLGWTLLPYGFLAGIPYQNVRFPLIVFPAVAVAVGAGIGAGVEAARHRRQGWRWAVWLGLTGIVVLGVAQMVSAGSERIQTFISNQQRDEEITSWAAEQIPEKATLYSFGLTLTLEHYTVLEVVELYYETEATLERRWQHGHHDYLLVNLWVIENQWQGREPQIAYYWLRDVRGLVQLGRNGNYTLFRVKG